MSLKDRVTEDMKGIEKQLSDGDKRGVTFVLFSLDPGRDTPEALRHFGAEHRLDPSHWRLFAMAEDSVRDLAAVLGVKYAAEENVGKRSHSNAELDATRDANQILNSAVLIHSQKLAPAGFCRFVENIDSNLPSVTKSNLFL